MNLSVKIGLTGGPGCGKSAAAEIFRTLPHWSVLDADRICHEIYAESYSPWCTLLEEHFGKEAITADGVPDRNFIAQKIFSDEQERLWLNSVLHPEIRRRIEEKIVCGSTRFIMIEVPLLFESSWEKSMDATVAIWSAPEIQMKRLLSRQWTKEHALARIKTQFPAEKKLALADYGLINNGTLQDLEIQCRQLAADLEKNIKSHQYKIIATGEWIK